MRLVWLCPTWNRPRCLAGLVRQFLDQDYPAEQLELLILDDAGQYENQTGDDGHGGKRWRLVSFNQPFPSLPQKYNAMLDMVESDGVVIAEDDDLYSPLHSAACAAALALGEVSKPSKVITHYGGKVNIEDATGRFHASIAVRTEFLRSLGGWPITHRADFDLQLLAKLASHGKVIDPLTCRHQWRMGWRNFEPTYTFRWETSQHTHAQAYGRGPSDEGWLERARAAAGAIVHHGRLVV